MNVSRSLTNAVSVAMLTGAFAFAQQPPEQLIELKAGGARLYAASRGQTLTGPAASAVSAIRSFLAGKGKSARALNSLVQVSESRSAANGITHVRLRQVVEGLEVYGAYVKASVNSRFELVHLIEILPEPSAQLVRSNVTARAALDAALAHLYPGRTFAFTEHTPQGNTVTFSVPADTFFFKNPTATRVALPLASGAMQEGWVVEIWTRKDNQLHHVVIGNGARILEVEERTANDSYSVFTEHPQVTQNNEVRGAVQTTVVGPGGGNAQSPRGWISADGRTTGTQSQFRLSGNNVYAYLDVDANNSADAGGTAITDGNFTMEANLLEAPTTARNRQVAIQNLFWANNVLHDQLYRYGFNEGAGNFQQNNFNNGGAGNDSVLAEAQDGSGTNNANFSTPNDGSSPRMQMFLWTNTSPNRDGDVDTDIVYHEYGHGLTWRMIGSMSGCMSGAVGEGSSDVLSILMNKDDVVGEYSYNNPIGIRRWPYSSYPRTYGSLTNEGVHAAGELLGAVMWRAKTYLANDDLTWKYFVDGMNYTPAGPKFEHLRDGIVQAAGGLTNDGCKIYKAFADFGVGEGASGSCVVKGFIFTTTSWTVNQSFNVPLACQSPVADIAVMSVSAPATVAPLSTSNVVVTVKNVGNLNVTTAFNVTLTANGTVLTSSPVTSLAVGATADRSFSWTAPASTGAVTLTGSHTFDDGSSANNAVSTTVSVVQPAAISLTVSVRNVKGTKSAELRWTPADGGTVHVKRNGNVIATVPNTGEYTDTPGKTVKTATYQVCSVETGACSNQVTVTF